MTRDETIKELGDLKAKSLKGHNVIPALIDAIVGMIDPPAPAPVVARPAYVAPQPMQAGPTVIKTDPPPRLGADFRMEPAAADPSLRPNPPVL